MSEERKWQALLATVRTGTQNDMEAFYNLAYLMAEGMRFPCFLSHRTVRSAVGFSE